MPVRVVVGEALELNDDIRAAARWEAELRCPHERTDGFQSGPRGKSDLIGCLGEMVMAEYLYRKGDTVRRSVVLGAGDDGIDLEVRKPGERRWWTWDIKAGTIPSHDDRLALLVHERQKLRADLFAKVFFDDDLAIAYVAGYIDRERLQRYPISHDYPYPCRAVPIADLRSFR